MNLPTVLLGRLAMDTRYHGQKPGELLLLHSLVRALIHSQEIAAFAVNVDAKSETTVNFYHRYGFVPLADTPQRLFLPMQTIAQLLSSSV